MKIILSFIWGSLLLFNTMNMGFAAGDSMAGFGFYREIPMNNPGLPYKEIFLDKDIYSRTNSEQSDILIFDEEGKVVPYYVLNTFTSIKDMNTKYTSELVGNFVKDDFEFFDFKVNKLGSNTDLTINIINLDIPTQDFSRNIFMLGSFDGINWKPIKTENIFNVNKGSNLRFYLDETVKYEYFRFRIPDRNNMIKINGITPIYFQEKVLEQKYTDYTNLEFSVESGTVSGLNASIDKTAKPVHTVLTVQNKDSLKLKSLSIDAQGDFKRTYDVYDTKPHNANALYLSGEIFSFKGDKNMLINFHKSTIFPLKMKEIAVKIYNNDNEPIKINSVKAEFFTDRIVFEAGKGTHKLYFGNREISLAPKYDLLNFREKIEKENRESCRLGAVNEIALPEVKNRNMIDNYKKPLINAVVLITALILIVIAGMKLKTYTPK